MTTWTFGIIGYGHFGAFLASSLERHGSVLVADADASKLPLEGDGIRRAPLAETAAADAVVLAVPFDALEDVLAEIRPLVRPETVLMDVVSTKARATGLLEDSLSWHPNVLATHPLFGPPSMESIEGQRLVVTFQRGEQAGAFRTFLEQELRLETIDVTPDEHDRQMAYMQALPFFIARALVELDIPTLREKSALSIPSFEKLATIASIEQHHSESMFLTSQLSNPYAEEARERFLDALLRLNESLRGPIPAP